jgi:hypothetical protein
MSFADPTSIAIGATNTPSGGTATSFPNQDRSTPYTGIYGTTDGLYKLKISHSLGSRKRSEFKVDMLTTYTDPATGLAKDISASCYLVLSRPNAGFTNAQLKALMSGVCAMTGVSANQDKLLGLES